MGSGRRRCYLGLALLLSVSSAHAASSLCFKVGKIFLGRSFPKKFEEIPTTSIRIPPEFFVHEVWRSPEKVKANAIAISKAATADEAIKLLIEEKGPESAIAEAPRAPRLQRTMKDENGPVQLLINGKENTAVVVSFSSAEALKRYYGGDRTAEPIVSVVDKSKMTTREIFEGLQKYSGESIPVEAEVHSLFHSKAFADLALRLYAETPGVETIVVPSDMSPMPNERSYRAIITAKMEALARADLAQNKPSESSWEKTNPKDLVVGSSVRGLLNNKHSSLANRTLVEFNGTVLSVNKGVAKIRCGTKEFDMDLTGDTGPLVNALYMRRKP